MIPTNEEVVAMAAEEEVEVVTAEVIEEEPKTGTVVTATVNKRSWMIDQRLKNYLTTKVGSLVWVVEGDSFLHPKKVELPIKKVAPAVGLGLTQAGPS